MAAILALMPTLAMADVAAGKQQFAAQCALCHTAQPLDEGGGQGPSLYGVFGRPAATVDAGYPYTVALKQSKLLWDPATLDRFLTNPSQLVPGTAMPMAVANKNDRDNIIAFFQSLAPAASAR